MKYFICLIFLIFPVIISLPAQAASAPCNPTNGTAMIHTSLDKTITNPADNKTGTALPDFFSWDAGAQYNITCDCTGVAGANPLDAPNFITTDLPAGHTEGTKIYRRINGNLEFYSQVQLFLPGIGNKFYDIPTADWISSQYNFAYMCPAGTKSSHGITNDGVKGKLSLYISKPFVGKSVIPPTVLYSLYLSLRTSYGETPVMGRPLMQLQISGNITVNQGCEIPAGYTVEFPFGEYNAHDFKGKNGTKPNNVRVIEKSLDFNCSNVSDGIKIYLKIEGQPNASNSSAIDLGNPDIAAVITDDKDNILKPNSADRAEMTVSPLMDNVHRNAQIKLKAYPIGTTGKEPTSGNFEGVATLDVNVE